MPLELNHEDISCAVFIKDASHLSLKPAQWVYIVPFRYFISDLDVEKLAKGTTGFTGADLENLVNQAALKAAMDNSTGVNSAHLEFAKDKVLMGK